MHIDKFVYFNYNEFIMKNLTISSTTLKRETARILNLVGFGEAEAVVEKYGEPIVKIIPIPAKKKVNLKDKLNKYFGAIPDFPSVPEKRYFRKRNVNL